ncbi:hypothetical protein AVME950_02195 [Acidovorax sp. SUPP950]|uniref:hypothetical protein n=1 Tax=Acidovorax sp. SUPP950 TaxID=511901 RepID=UPI0023C91512|nr:hypothetical protein [Acidovorax sp. SUPP950]GKS73657.1 hypothetical protein AVME950_02195 [Acidovorax sp. SUPP950]
MSYQPPRDLEESERLLRKARDQEHFWQNLGADAYAIVFVLAAVAALSIFFLGVSAVVGSTGAIVVAALYFLLRGRIKGG